MFLFKIKTFSMLTEKKSNLKKKVGYLTVVGTCFFMISDGVRLAVGTIPSGFQKSQKLFFKIKIAHWNHAAVYAFVKK